MAEQIRSADVLVKTAFANPEIIQALKENPEGTLKRLGERAVESLPHVLTQPDPRTNNAIGIIIVLAFSAVMLGSAYVFVAGVGTKLETGATYVTRGGNGAHAVHDRCRVSGWAAVAQSSDSEIERRGPTEATPSTKVGDITSCPWRQGGRFINAFNLNCLHS